MITPNDNGGFVQELYASQTKVNIFLEMSMDQVGVRKWMARLTACAFILQFFIATEAGAEIVDFNGDGKSDLVWHNAVTGATSTWLMDGIQRVGAATLLTSPDWKVIGQPDLNGDGKSDLIWYNATTGQTGAWLMNGVNRIGSATLLSDRSWKVIGTPDLNGDGKSDILWRNTITGATSAWLMDGLTRVGSAVLLTDGHWQVVCTPDLDGDGRADILWYNSSTGATSVWLMNGLKIASASTLLVNANYKVVGTPDFNGDGRSDLLWYNSSTGSTSVWLMDGARIISAATILVDPHWRVVGTADFNGDGKADILWRNAVSGSTSTWLMNGTTRIGGATLLTDSNWEVSDTPDLNGDGRSDIIWHNSSTGATSAWLMNGAAALSFATLLVDQHWTAASSVQIGPLEIPAITNEPAVASIVVPQTATFSVIATGGAPLSYQWQVSTDGITFVDISGAIASSYTTPQAAVSDSGKSFRVRVSNNAGSILSSAAVLTVAATGTPPAVISNSTDYSVLAPEIGVFTVQATGSPAPRIQWQSSIDGGRTFVDVLGANSTSYKTSATNLSSNGAYYRAVVANSLGTATSRPSKLTVYNPGIGGLVSGVAVDRTGNLFATVSPDTISYISTFRNALFVGIRRIDINGAVTTFAGNQTRALVNGTGTGASFISPYGLVVDASGNLFVSDVYAIRKITPAGVVTTFAGGDASGGFVDGVGSQASFSGLAGLAIDGSNNLYVADSNNGAIRKITAGGIVTTLAAGFNSPYGVAVGSNGMIYVADTFNHAIRSITPNGVVATIAGGLYSGLGDGTGSNAAFKFPRGLAVDSHNILWVADTNNNALRKVTLAGVVTTVTSANGTYNSIVTDSHDNLYMDFNFGLPFSSNSPYELQKITPAGVNSYTPNCCYKAP